MYSVVPVCSDHVSGYRQSVSVTRKKAIKKVEALPRTWDNCGYVLHAIHTTDHHSGTLWKSLSLGHGKSAVYPALGILNWGMMVPEPMDGVAYIRSPA